MGTGEPGTTLEGTLLMNRAAQLYYARKFFAHLGDRHGVLCVQAILTAHRIPFEPWTL